MNALDLSALFAEYAGEISGYVHARIYDPDDADDIAASVWLRAVAGAAGFSGGNARAWLYAIARARMIDYYRTHRITDSLSPRLPDRAATPEEQIEWRLEWERVDSVFQRLTSEQQRVLLLRFFGGYSPEETAATLGIPVGAVKARQHRALATLGRGLGGR